MGTACSELSYGPLLLPYYVVTLLRLMDLTSEHSCLPVEQAALLGIIKVNIA